MSHPLAPLATLMGHMVEKLESVNPAVCHQMDVDRCRTAVKLLGSATASISAKDPDVIGRLDAMSQSAMSPHVADLLRRTAALVRMKWNDAVVYNEVPCGPLVQTWRPTTDLRYKKIGLVRQLQQKWVSDDGDESWRAVPEVTND